MDQVKFAYEGRAAVLKNVSMHIEKVMDGIRENTTRVWNTKAYLMAALFNSVSTIDNHYTMLVNHDFHSGL